MHTVPERLLSTHTHAHTLAHNWYACTGSDQTTNESLMYTVPQMCCTSGMQKPVRGDGGSHDGGGSSGAAGGCCCSWQDDGVGVLVIMLLNIWHAEAFSCGGNSPLMCICCYPIYVGLISCDTGSDAHTES